MGDNELLVLNPRRRRRGTRRRKMSALQRLYFGGGRRHRTRRNDPDPNPRRRYHRRRSSPRYTVRHVLARRRNPVVGGKILTPMFDIVKDAITGTVGIGVNNAIGNTLASKVVKVVGNKRSGVKVGTAVILGGLVSMFLPQWKRYALLGASTAVSVEAIKALNRHVLPQLGKFGELVSTSDGEMVGPASPGSAMVPQNLQYNTEVKYLPGGTFAERGSPRLGAYVRRVASMGSVPADAGGIYDSSPGVY